MSDTARRIHLFTMDRALLRRIMLPVLTCLLQETKASYFFQTITAWVAKCLCGCFRIINCSCSACYDTVVHIIPLCMKKQKPNTSVLQQDALCIIGKLIMTQSLSVPSIGHWICWVHSRSQTHPREDDWLMTQMSLSLCFNQFCSQFAIHYLEPSGLGTGHDRLLVWMVFANEGVEERKTTIVFSVLHFKTLNKRGI